MAEDDYLPLSGVQHYVFCQRQCALIHVEGVFEENVFTVEGRLWHASVDAGVRRARDDVDVETSVWLRSERLALIGRADRVEIHPAIGGVRLVPVESKRSRRKSLRADCMQLCAQAMALEEMRGVDIPRGALYYIKSRRRLSVDFTPELRVQVADAAGGFHALVRERRVPPPHADARCRDCSLRASCLPVVVARAGRIRDYLHGLLADGGTDAR